MLPAAAPLTARLEARAGPPARGEGRELARALLPLVLVAALAASVTFSVATRRADEARHGRLATLDAVLAPAVPAVPVGPAVASERPPARPTAPASSSASPTSSPSSSPTSTVAVGLIVDGSLRSLASTPAAPRRLTLGPVDAAVDPVGVAADGWIDVPAADHADHADRAGWYRYSAGLEGHGTVVIVGHVDSDGRPGVFFTLRERRVGEEVRLESADGRSRRYVVVEVRAVPKAQLADQGWLGSRTDQLVLVTCGGAFDADTGHYADNIVVRAAPIDDATPMR